ncbi:MORC family CW-type zinc finger protein 4 [Hondaea fermentalgiana]|uniref:MORC family CW-type zinc finger protein 4 n=1 Tax=Hondaea fermentalgiana TaxID=2315210 RepID=A0A2R5GA77_9STRA|nr:MORC family CW-type zinc finger protein 4 [Hondaea fermentalgiana]|eukprot:GBG27922.1 MORC family CW-type zinc finger protein 4 [Hondaea fermentalgiana]
MADVKAALASHKNDRKRSREDSQSGTTSKRNNVVNTSNINNNNTNKHHHQHASAALNGFHGTNNHHNNSLGLGTKTPPSVHSDPEQGAKPRSTSRSSSKKASASKAAAAASSADDAAQLSAYAISVQCDKCGKWRDIPPGKHQENLPERWFCRMNTWEPAYASCDAPQKDELSSSAAASPAPVAPEAAPPAKRSKKRHRSNANGVAAPPSAAGDAGSAATADGSAGAANGQSNTSGPVSRQSSAERASASRRANKKAANGGKGKRGKNEASSADAASSAAKPRNLRAGQNNMIKDVADPETKPQAQWVMCETCQQWRRLAPHVDVASLPEKWYCNMNYWDKTRASCSVPQETDEPPEQEAAAHGESKSAIVRLPEGVNLYGGPFLHVNVKGKRHAPPNFRQLIVNHYRHFGKYDSSANVFHNVRYHESSLFVPRGNVRGRGVKKTAQEKGLVAAPATSISLSSRKFKGISMAAIIPETTFARLFLRDPDADAAHGSPGPSAFPPLATHSPGPVASSASSSTSSQASSSASRNSSPGAGASASHANKTAVNVASPGPVDSAEVPGEDALDKARRFIEDDDQDAVPTSLLKISKPWKRAGGFLPGAPYYCKPASSSSS